MSQVKKVTSIADSTKLYKSALKIELPKLKGKQSKFYAALIETHGNVTAAERLTHIDRQTHYWWLRSDENYKNWIDKIQDITVDFYEAALHNLIDSGDKAATIFALKAKGKLRGWIERTEVVNSGSMNITNVQPDDLRDRLKKLDNQESE